MATEHRYALPIEQTQWSINSQSEVTFRWEYDDGRDNLLKLYDKGKKQQWDAADRIDWSQDLDPENPMLMPDYTVSIFGSPVWEKMTQKERNELRRHSQAWSISQFMHGEQGALIATAKIVEEVPNMDAKFYAATQVMDEARHVEAYARLLHEKFDLAYPITKGLQSLLADTVNNKNWDFTYLGMQVLIEGLALAAFHRMRDDAQNHLAAQVNAYVMQDEARHVAFGRLSLRDFYPQLTQYERDEREEFVVESCYHMRDRFNTPDIWNVLGLPVKECMEFVENSDTMRQFRTRLFTRIVPIVKDIGLWGEKVQKAFTDMGVIDMANIDMDQVLDYDQKVADQFDAGEIERFALSAAE